MKFVTLWLFGDGFLKNFFSLGITPIRHIDFCFGNRVYIMGIHYAASAMREIRQK